MKRIYCDEVIELTTEEGKEFCLKLYDLFEDAYKSLLEDNYKIFLSIIYDYIRDKFNLPNKLLTMGKRDDGAAVFAMFPKEPDGGRYKVGCDEESKRIYILVEE